LQELEVLKSESKFMNSQIQRKPSNDPDVRQKFVDSLKVRYNDITSQLNAPDSRKKQVEEIIQQCSADVKETISNLAKRCRSSIDGIK